MPSELAREQKLAASTVVEHLKVLENAALIKRVETGHKWTYYELTRKGQELAAPRLPMQHIIILGLGLLLMFGGLGFMQTVAVPLYGQPSTVTSEQGAAGVGTAAVPDKLATPAEAPAPIRAPDLVPPAVSILVLGTVLSLYGGWSIWKSR
jgi:hypothetical protein